MLARMGPSTPYDLTQAVQNSVGYFWPFPRSQMYCEAPKLVAEGLATEQREEEGRRRRLFRITKAGRAALREWLADSEMPRFELRDQGLLKLLFHDFGADTDLERLSTHLAASYREMVDELESVELVHGNEAQNAALELGIKVMQTVAEFWEERSGG
jgi:DNA-binding PadR family transcriptional regulator